MSTRFTTLIQDIGWLLAIGLLLPLWMFLALLGLLVIIVRHLYLWARGNLTASSRPPRGAPSFWTGFGSSLRFRRRVALPHEVKADRVARRAPAVSGEIVPEANRP